TPYADLPLADLGLQPVLPATATQDDWPPRRRALEQAWRERLGRPPAKPADLDVRTESTEHLDGYTRKLVSFSAADGDRVLAYLLVPDGLKDGAKRPAVVVFHQTTKDTLREPVGLGKNPS